MKPSIDQKYRTQAIDLQPYGNTISVEAASDNPFEADQDVEIYTQASGGMAGPDQRMRSRGLLIKRPGNTGVRNGRVKTYRVNINAASGGFFPGMGDLDGTGRRVRKTVRVASRHGFMPGLSGNGFFPGMGAGEVPPMLRPAQAQPSGTNWGAITSDVLKTGAGVFSAVQAPKIEQARAAQAVAAQRTQESQERQAGMMARIGQGTTAAVSNMGEHKTLVIGLGIVAAAALGYALFLRKKK